MKNNTCKRVSTDREAVELLSRENPEIAMDRGSFENLSGRQRVQKFSSMDQEAVKDLLRSQEEGSIERIFVDDVTRSCQA